MIGFWRALFAFLFLPLYIGGSSRASTATTTNYTTSDDRVAAAEGAIVTRLDGSDVAGGTVLKFTGSGNTVTTADPGVVKAALDFAAKADAAAGITMENILSRQSDAMMVANAQGKGIFSERSIFLLLGAGVLALFVLKKG